MKECENQIELTNLKLAEMSENENDEGLQYFSSKLERAFPFGSLFYN